eukprot:COSAG02_NODE_548_length_20472_cov_5.958524_11_plen_159_part_00
MQRTTCLLPGPTYHSRSARHGDDRVLHQQPATHIPASSGRDDDMGLLVFEEQPPPSPPTTPAPPSQQKKKEKEKGRNTASPIIILIMRHSPNARRRRLALLHLLLLAAPPRHPPHSTRMVCRGDDCGQSQWRIRMGGKWGDHSPSHTHPQRWPRRFPE